MLDRAWRAGRRLAVLACALAIGCASVRGEVAYATPCAASQQATLHAAYLVADRLGARTVEISSARGELSAILGGDETSREHLIVRAPGDGTVAVALRTELVDERGEWVAPCVLCDSYAFTREQEIARQVVTIAELLARR